ncbi:MAG: transporter substrate-binding domain-containing protein [Saprospiraceae bacterium]|nr:transporter substrate-binding domain-containing protein [Saprospiraceae bacterium]
MRRLITALLLICCLSPQALAQITSDTLTIGYTRAAPFIILEEEAQLKGLSIWLWERIAEDLQIPYEFKLMGFNDMLEALKDGSIDGSINPLTITSERSKYMDFTHSFFVSNSTAAIRKTSSFQKFINYARSLFSLNFLSGLLILMIIIGLFGLAAWLFERKYNETQFRKGLAGIWDGLWWSAVTMTTVGYGDKSPKSTGGKVIALIWMFTALLFISGFTASIASTLTVNQLKWSPQGINDFKDQTVGCVAASGTLDYLDTHFFSDIQRFDGLAGGLNALGNQEIEAFLYDEPIMKYRIANDPDYQDLEVLPVKFDLQFYAFAFPKKHFEIKEQVSQKILEYTENIEWRLILAEYDLSQL